MLLELDQIRVGYATTEVVRGVSLTLAEGEIGALLGPSGCGKTTLLRAIAGFEPLRSGVVRLAGRDLSREQWQLPPEQRGVGMVFQDFALFPHLNVSDNIGFGLRHWSRSDRRERVLRLLALVGLSAYGEAWPHQLSGGQQQRIALARALAPRPQLLLLDEPFSGLDVELREGLAREVREILRQEGIGALMVTHDQLEAFAMADRIGVVEQGSLRQWATGYDLYHYPADRFVADFIGQGVFLPGRVSGAGEVMTELGLLLGRMPTGCRVGCAVEVLLRPDDLIDIGVDDTERSDAVEVRVLERLFRGAEFLYTVALPSGTRLLCLTHSHHNYPPGSTIWVRPDAGQVAIFPVSVTD